MTYIRTKPFVRVEPLDKTGATGDVIARAALSYVGTPFMHQGRWPGTGLDCGGILACSARAAGKTVRERPDYSRRPGRHRLRDALRANGWTEVQFSKRQTGDFLTMWYTRRGVEEHAAVVVGKGMVHVMQNGRVVYERAVPEFWLPRVLSAWRAP